MKKILEYSLGFFCWMNTLVCPASERFEILPDLPDPLAAYAQSAEASTVSGNTNLSSLVGGGSVGHEPSILSVIFSLLIVILLIYVTGILYAKLNKMNAGTLRKQQGILKSQASVISTTALGNNKTLHVIELDGKRMLIGASSGAIQLIKDLGSVSEEDREEEFSSIEIPTIKIPKIEIPKIEIPTIGFSKLATRIHKEFAKNIDENNTENEDRDPGKSPEEMKEEENSGEIIDTLFTKSEPEEIPEPVVDTVSEHVVNPDEYELYKKYLG